MAKGLKKAKGELMPGNVLETKSGSFLAFYEHRTDIIANGENEKQARNNLKKMYKIVVKHEQKEQEKKTEIELPKGSKIKRFKEVVEC